VICSTHISHLSHFHFYQERRILDAQGCYNGKKLNLKCKVCTKVGNGKDTGFTRIISDVSEGELYDPDDGECCLRRILYLQPDFSESYGTNAATEAARARGHIVCFLPKAHPELNAVELLWALVKHRVREQNSGTYDERSSLCTCARACVCVCMRACVCACARVCVRVCLVGKTLFLVENAVLNPSQLNMTY
jgi:hypothetical protein